MLDEAQLVGYTVLAVITLGSFVAVIQKFSKPINDLEKGFTSSMNDLKVAIQELKDCIDTLKENNSEQNRRLSEHGKEIDDLKDRVTGLETKMKLYHHE